MKKVILIFISTIFWSVNLAICQSDSINQASLKPKMYPTWTLFVPGATHFYDHRLAEGIIFSSTEIAGITLGLLNDNKLKSQSSTPYYNFPLLIGIQAYNVDKCDFFRKELEYIKYRQPNFRYDPIKFNDLLVAPFKTKNIFTPITGGLVLVAVAELCLGINRHTQYFRDINQMYFIDHYINPNQALAIYGATSLASSYGAGISEEYVFRNALMPILDYKYGQKRGLIYSSLLFGSMHFSNILFSNNPDIGQTLLQVGEASIIGYLLGNDVQRRGYNIGPAVTAHMWYDFTLMLGSFLIDPKNNYLGVSMKFNIE